MYVRCALLECACMYVEDGIWSSNSYSLTPSIFRTFMQLLQESEMSHQEVAESFLESVIARQPTSGSGLAMVAVNSSVLHRLAVLTCMPPSVGTSRKQRPFCGAMPGLSLRYVWM